MKNGKAVGADGIPSGVWKHSAVARDALYAFLRKVWSKEEVPKNLTVCIFIMMYKKKGSHNDCSKYRAIGLLNHTYKIMSVVLLRRLVEECKDFLASDRRDLGQNVDAGIIYSCCGYCMIKKLFETKMYNYIH